MKLQVFVLLALALCATEGRRHKGRRYAPKYDGQCDFVQPFEPNKVYTYKYVATTENRDDESRTANEIRINCTATITVPQRCSAKLRMRDCSVETAVSEAGSPKRYQLHPDSVSFDRQVSVKEMAFHFNAGQITAVFVDKNEWTNITNFKRGFLSSIQAYSPLIPRDAGVGQVYEIPQMNVYGTGVVEHRINRISEDGFPSQVEVIRNTSNIDLPWERKQWNFLRMRNNRANPIVAALKNYVTLKNDEMWGKPVQRCVYELLRGRKVASGRCEEVHPLDFSYPYFQNNASQNQQASSIRTTVRQMIDTLGYRPMTSRDRSQWDTSKFDEDTIMFEEEWEETHAMYDQQFDAETAFMQLLRFPASLKSPAALVSKLARWMAVASQDKIQALWNKCDRQCDRLEKEWGRQLYAELLDSCVKNDWCPVQFCSKERPTACQEALESFARSNANRNPQIKNLTLQALSNVYAPSEQIVDITLRTCRSEEVSSPECVSALGKVIKNFYDACEDSCSDKKSVEKAKFHLEKLLQRNCESSDRSTEEVMVQAVEAIGKLGQYGVYARPTVLRCATNLNAPVRVAVKSLVTYANITDDNVQTEDIKKIVRLFASRDAPVPTRITCFHLMMRKNITESDLQSVINTIMRTDESQPLVQHCKKDIHSQMMLRETSFCQFHPEVIVKYAAYILNGQLDVGIPREQVVSKPLEKTYEMEREVFLPVFNVTTNCSIKLQIVYESQTSRIPVIAQVTVDAVVEGQRINIVEGALNIAGLKQVMDRIFGEQMVYAEMISKVLKTPMSQLVGYAQQHPDIQAITTAGKYAHIMDLFNTSNVPVALRILGYEIDINSLMSIDFIRKYTLGSFWEIIDALKEGIQQDVFFVGQPFLMQHASPSCIGAPMISTIDFSYIFKNKMNVKADLRKLLFVTNERGHMEFNPEFHVTASVHRTILKQFYEKSGTQMKLRLGHSSGMNCAIDRTEQGAAMSCTPKEGRTKVLYVSAKRSLESDDKEIAQRYCKDYRLQGLSSKLQVCYEPLNASGFEYIIAIDQNAEVEYRSSIESQSYQQSGTGDNAKRLSLKLTAEDRPNPKSRKTLLSSKLDLYKARNEVHIEIDGEVIFWTAKAKALMPVVKSAHGLEISFNCSRLVVKQQNDGDRSLQYLNSLWIMPITDKKYVLEGECKWPQEASQGLAGVTLSGSYDEVPKGISTVRSFHLNAVDIENQHASSLLDVSFEANKTDSSTLPGFESKLSVEGAVLPVFGKYVFEIGTHHNQQKYDKVLRFSAHYRESSHQPLFFVQRISGNFKQQDSKAYSAEVNCISNWFRCEYSSLADQHGDLDVQGNVNIPESAISFNLVVPSESTNMFSYNVKYAPAQSRVIKWRYMTEPVQGDNREHNVIVEYDVWNPVTQQYELEAGHAKFVKYNQCPFCHLFEIQHPKLSVISISKRGESYHEEKWFKIHYSVLKFVPSPAFVTHYILNNLERDQVQLGYNIQSSSSVDNLPSDVTYQVAILNNVADFQRSVNRASRSVNVTCEVSAPCVDSRFRLSYDDKKDENQRRNMDATLEGHYGSLRFNAYSKVNDVSDIDTKIIAHAQYGPITDIASGFEDNLDITMHGSQSFDFTGKYDTTFKKTGEKKEHKLLGSSSKVSGSWDLEFQMMCADSQQVVCAQIDMNKHGKWVELKSRVDNTNFDRISIINEEGRYVLTTEVHSQSYIDWNELSVVLEVSPSYEFEIGSPLFNASFKYDTQDGFNVSHGLSTPIYAYLYQVGANKDGASYKYQNDLRKLGGVRLNTSACVDFGGILRGELLSGQLVLGSSPESSKFMVKTPYFAYDWDKTSDFMEPTPYKNYADVLLEPYKITLSKINTTLYERRVQIVNTSASYKYNENSRSPEIKVQNVNISVEPQCQERSWIVVTGDALVSKEQVSIRVSDPEKTFACVVDLSASSPLKQHIEFVVNLKRSKWELLWDMNKESRRMSMTANCKVSITDWRTSSMTPFVDFSLHNEMTATQAPQNFPTVTMDLKFNHSIHTILFPTQTLITLSTVHDAEVTTLLGSQIFNNRTYGGLNATLTGCYKRLEIAEGFTMCMPNNIQSNLTYLIPYLLRYTHIMDLSKDSNNEWMLNNAFNYSIPLQIHLPPLPEYYTIPLTLDMKVVIGESNRDPIWKIFIPSTVHMKNIHATMPECLDRWFMGWYHPSSYKYYDISVENGDVLITHTATQEVRSIAVTSTLPIHRSTEEYDLKLLINNNITTTGMSTNTTVVMPTRRFSHFIGAWYVPNTWRWNFKHVWEMPRFTMMNDMSWRGLYPDSINFDFETTGWIHQIKFYMNKDLECIFNVGNMSSSITKRGRNVDCHFNYESIPELSQTLTWTYDIVSDMNNYVANYDTAYFHCVSKFATRRMRVSGKLFDCTMKNHPAGIKVEYIKEGDKKRCDIMIKTNDNKKISCKSTPMPSPSSSMTCSMIEGSTTEVITTIPVTMRDFPYMNERVNCDKVLFFSRLSNMMLKASVLSEYYFERYFQMAFRCEREEMCYDLAKRFQSTETAMVKEIRRILGPKFMYLTDPSLLQYAINQAIASQVGYPITILPEQNSDLSSISETLQQFLSGQDMALIHWSVPSFLESKAGIKLIGQENFTVYWQIQSPSFNWLNWNMSIGTEQVEGDQIVNFTSSYFGMTYSTVMGFNHGKVYPLIEQYCEGAGPCKSGMVMEYNWEVHHGTYNVSAYFLRDERLMMACDVLVNPQNWMNSKLMCYEDMSRQHLIGNLSLPGIQTLSSQETLSVDQLLRDALQMKSKQHRSMVSSKLNGMMDQISKKVAEQVPLGQSGKLVVSIIQYVLASEFHEASKYINSTQLYDAVIKFGGDLIYSEQSTIDIIYDIASWWNKTSFGHPKNSIFEITTMISSFYSTLSDMFQGNVVFDYAIADDSLVLTYHHKSFKYPSLNLKSVWRITRVDPYILKFKTQWDVKSLTANVDFMLDTTVVYMEKVRFSLPEMPEEFAEVRFLPNKFGEWPVLELYFNDMDSNYYGCRGVPAHKSPVLHVHCYQTEKGQDLPPNPPISELFSYWDLYIEELPTLSPTTIYEVLNYIASTWRNMKTCSDSDFVDNTLNEVYHIQDPKIRRRLTSTVNQVCQNLVKPSAQKQGTSESQAPNGYGSQTPTSTVLAKLYKSFAYDIMKYSMSQNVFERTAYAVKVLDFRFVDNVVNRVAAFSAPMVQYGFDAVKFLKVSGNAAAHRCTECTEDPMKIISMLFILRSERLSFLDNTVMFHMLPNNSMTTQFLNTLGWIRIDSLYGYGLKTKAIKFGLMNSVPYGVEVNFYPEVSTGETPTMSLVFENSKKWLCDATFQDMTCTKSGRQGPVSATCDITPMKTLRASWELALETVGRTDPRPYRIGEVLNEVCQWSDPSFNSSISEGLVRPLKYMKGNVKTNIQELAQAILDLFDVTGSTVMDAIIDLYDYWCQVLPTIDTLQELQMATFSIPEHLFDLTAKALKTVYSLGHKLNEYLYDLPHYIQLVREWIFDKDYSEHLHYLQILASNAMRGDNCLFGIVSTPENENILSLNKKYYKIPSDKMARCPYSLASDVVSNAFEIIYARGDIEIHLPGMSIAVDKTMRVFNITDDMPRSEISLPVYRREDSCVAKKDMVYCRSRQISATIYGRNNRRDSLFVRVSEPYCSQTRGLAGIGGKMNVPDWPLPDSTSAKTMEEFVDAYSTDKSCHIESIEQHPASPNTYCQDLFQSKELVASCPEWRPLFMKTCNSANPTSKKEACRFAKMFVSQCNTEGSPALFPPTCETCEGQTSKTSGVNKVLVTVLMSLSSRYDASSLEEIIRAVHDMARTESLNYEVTFVTYGGRCEGCGPALYLNNSRTSWPTSEPWRVPAVRRVEISPMMDSLESALWFSVMNTESVASGVGRMFILATPEDLDYTVLSQSTIANRMEDELIETYLLVPDFCSRTAAKTRATYGVRRLFTERSRDICKASADKVASEMKYGNMNARVNCVCKVENPFTGQTRVACLSPRA